MEDVSGNNDAYPHFLFIAANSINSIKSSSKALTNGRQRRGVGQRVKKKDTGKEKTRETERKNE